MAGVCVAAAELASPRCSRDVIDLRTLWPWDREAVFESVSRTGRLLVVHQAVRTGGFGAEIVAEVTEHLFAKLTTAPRRLAAPRVPVPYAEPLEALCRVSAEQIAEAAVQIKG